MVDRAKCGKNTKAFPSYKLLDSPKECSILELPAIGATKAAIDLIKSAYGWIRGRRALLSNEEILARRLKWKPIFDERLAEVRRDRLGRDVTIRDINRLNQYPNIDEGKKGISPWFRVGLAGTTETSLLLNLGWMTPNPEAIKFLELQGLQLQNALELGNAALIGYVPFEQIVDVRWDSDDYNTRSSIFLHFDAQKGEPYSRLALCRRKTMDGHNTYQIEWYSEICGLLRYQDACCKLGLSTEIW
jgi:hypothetical protein